MAPGRDLFVNSVTPHTRRQLRCRDLQPPPPAAAGWPEQREALLHRVSAVLDGGGKSSRQNASGEAAAADADAIAAAERAMQELLVRSAVPSRRLFEPHVTWQAIGSWAA